MMKHTLAIATAMALIPTAAFAATEDEEAAIEEIVVTATHRETNLMDTPQAISAVSGELIEQLGAVDMQSLFKNIVGLNMAEGASAGTNRYLVRGIASQAGTRAYSQTFAAVSVYLDDVPMTTAQGPASQFGGNLFDVARVEVLKGPQGTLFGEGSVGGTIRFLQNEPRLGEFDYKVKAGVNSVDESNDLGTRLDAMVNIPLNDVMALRLTGFRNEKAGYIDKLNYSEDDVNSELAVGGRASLRWNVTDSIAITPTYYNVTTESEGAMVAFEPYVENFNARFPGLPPRSTDEVEIFSLDVEWEFGWGAMEILGSYMDRNLHTVTESPAAFAARIDTVIQLFALFRAAQNPLEIPTMIGEGLQFTLFNPTLQTNNLAYNPDDTRASKRKVLELRFLSAGEGDWRWTAGLFVKDSDDLRRQIQQYLLRPPLARETAPVTFAAFDSLLREPANDHQDTLDEMSVYGELTYDASERLELTLGARVTDMEQVIDNSRAKTNDTVVSPKLGIAWRPAVDTLTYFNITTGFRPGNLNLAMDFNARVFEGFGDQLVPTTPIAPNPLMLTGNQAAARALGLLAYDGDSVVNYELGLKTRLLDGRLNLTSSLYYLDWEDTILLLRDAEMPNFANLYNLNSGAAHSAGIEIETMWSINDAWRLRFGGDRKQAEIDEDIVNVAAPIPKGTELPRSPKWTVNATLDYRQQLANGWEFSGSVNYTRMARQDEALGDTTPLPMRYQTDLRFGLSAADDSWQVTLYARNLTGEDTHTVDCSTAQAPSCFVFQAPRIIGLEVTWHPPSQ